MTQTEQEAQVNSITDCPTCVAESQDKPVVKAGPNTAGNEVTANGAQQEEDKEEEPESK